MSADEHRRPFGMQPSPGTSTEPQPPGRPGRTASTRQTYGTIVIVGGGCYGSYYLRQLRRAAVADALTWRRLIVVDRNADCRAARDSSPDAEIAVREWADYFTEFLGLAASDPEASAQHAIVPSPLMPHLLFDWIVDRSRKRWPGRPIAVQPLAAQPDVPWQRSSPDAATHYVSFAEWMCPINCIEPVRCPATRGARTWTMPAAITGYVDAERARGHNLAGPFVFHCTHRAYGVGMVDVSGVLAADAAIRALAERGTVDAIVGTMSHCHGAIGRLVIE